MCKFYKIITLIAALALSDCGGAPTSSGGNSTPASSPKTETKPLGEKIGVPECDEYLEKYEACLPKLPENERGQIKGSLDLYRMIWKEDAKTPEGKAKLAENCKGVMEISKQTTVQYGCTW